MTVLVTVKAYPTVSERHGEAVCVAGIRTDVVPHSWVRLFPVPYRDLPLEQRFQKWQVIDLEAQRGADTRPESYIPIVPTIRLGRVVGTGNGWAERRMLVEPFLQPSMCGVRSRRKAEGTSLALIRPREVTRLEITKAEGWSPGQRGIVGQGRLDDLDRSRQSLEELPYKFGSERDRVQDPPLTGSAGFSRSGDLIQSGADHGWCACGVPVG
jgi:hypothetical protein